MERRVNKHHVMYERRNYKSKVERRFRNMGGLVVPTLIENHRELHATLRPPKKPRIEMIYDVIDIMQGNHYEGTEGVYVAQEYFYNNAHTNRSPQRASLALGIANHLGKQLVFLEKEG